MNYTEFSKLIGTSSSPVILVEGTRELPAEQSGLLTALATHLARSFPLARFRTGNAKGSDEAFAKGVASVDASRLELILPYAGHRLKNQATGATSTAIDDLPTSNLQEVVESTLAASPQYERIAVNYREKVVHPRRRASAQLILRDTLKVAGTAEMPPPVAGIFYVNAVDPDRGGTGHTMRVCRLKGIPVINQFQWLEWNLG